MSDKQNFVKEMQALLQQTDEYADIDSLDYVVEEDGQEWLYVSFKGFSQKRINVNCDSKSAILRDFLFKVDKAEWLMPTETRQEFFTE